MLSHSYFVHPEGLSKEANKEANAVLATTLMVGVTVAASCTFMLPVATPPNAVVFGSGYLKIPDMVKTGIWMNLISIVLLTIITCYLLPILWDFDITVFPEALKID